MIDGARSKKAAAGVRSVFATVDEALAELKAGRFVIVVDDEGRENEGDLVCAAARITAERVRRPLTHRIRCTKEMSICPPVFERTAPAIVGFLLAFVAGQPYRDKLIEGKGYYLVLPVSTEIRVSR